MSQHELGIIFDFDGTIVISEPLHMQAWAIVGQEMGRTVPEFILEQGVGATDVEVSQNICREWRGEVEAEYILNRKCAVYEGLAGEAPYVAGFEEFLAAIKQRNIPVGIATSAHRADIAPVLDGRDLRGKFDAIATVEDVRHPKPAPEIYLRVAKSIGVAPERCIGFEDSPAGAQAVRAAGMTVVGMTTTFSGDRLGHLDLELSRYPDPDELLKLLKK